nr:glycosyltransferase family 1 protein [Ardenticatena sp.]
MRIGIDARILAYRRAGIGQYTLRLVEHLARIDRDNEYILLQSRKDLSTYVSQPNFKRATIWTPSHHRLEPWALSVETARLGLDLLHSPDFIPPFWRTYKSVITIHDLGFLIFPHFVKEDAARHYGKIDRAVRHADHIIAVSHSTKKDIMKLLGVSSERITVIHEAANPIYRPIRDQEQLDAIRRKYDLPQMFVLFVSTIEPRKNLPTLLQALHRLKNEYRTELVLAVAGEKGWLYEDVFQLVHRLKLGKQVRFLGRVPLEDLPLLYNAAMVHVHPSYYEGFGLTPLEAMACGTPTIVSNVSSLPEVVGDAGLRVNPEDDEELAVAIWRVLNDSALRDMLREKGLKRARMFSWEKAAHEHLRVYMRVLGQPLPERPTSAEE